MYHSTLDSRVIRKKKKPSPAAGAASGTAGVVPHLARGCRFSVWGFVLGVCSLGFGVWSLGFGVWGVGFGVWGLGFGVWG